MRRCGSTEQRLWLGPSRYSCSRGRRVAKPDPDPDTYSNSVGDTICNAYAKRASGKSNANANDHAFTHSPAKSNTQTSPEPASQTVRRRRASS
jgi:hypothetical protein